MSLGVQPQIPWSCDVKRELVVVSSPAADEDASARSAKEGPVRWTWQIAAMAARRRQRAQRHLELARRAFVCDPSDRVEIDIGIRSHARDQPGQRGVRLLRLLEPRAGDCRAVLEPARELERRFDLLARAASRVERHLDLHRLTARPVDRDESIGPPRRTSRVHHEEPRVLRRRRGRLCPREIAPHRLDAPTHPPGGLRQCSEESLPPLASLSYVVRERAARKRAVH